MNRRSKTLAGAGVIIAAVTVIVSWLCIKDWSGITPAGLALMVWAELALFGGLILTERISEHTESLLLHTSYTAILLTYSVCAFTASLIFINLLKDSTKSFIITHLVLAAAAAILLMVFHSTSKSIYESHLGTERTAKQIEGCTNRLAALAVAMGKHEYASIVSRAAEELKFTDSSVAVSVDLDIEQSISELEIELGKEAESQSAERIRKTVTGLNTLIARRKMETAAVKKGGL